MSGEHDGRARDAAARRLRVLHPRSLRLLRTPFQGDRAEGLDGQGEWQCSRRRSARVRVPMTWRECARSHTFESSQQKLSNH
jgi:hypothetical protein